MGSKPPKEVSIMISVIYDPIEVLLIYYGLGNALPQKFFLIPHPEAESWS